MNGKKVLSLDKWAAGGEIRWLPCCWDDCENTGTTLHQTRFHDHARGWPCDHPEAKHPIYVFCSERHRQYFLNSHIAHGKLGAGHRNTVG